MSIPIIYKDKVCKYPENILKLSTHVKYLYETFKDSPIPLNGDITDKSYEIFQYWLNLTPGIEFDVYDFIFYADNAYIKSELIDDLDFKTCIELLRFAISNQILLLANQIACKISTLEIKISYENYNEAFTGDTCKGVINNEIIQKNKKCFFIEKIDGFDSYKFCVSITEAMLVTKYVNNLKNIPRELLKCFRYNLKFDKKSEKMFSVETLIFKNILSAYLADKNLIIYNGSKCLEKFPNIDKVVNKQLSGSDLGRTIGDEAINHYIENNYEYCIEYLKKKFPVTFEEYNTEILNSEIPSDFYGRLCKIHAVSKQDIKIRICKKAIDILKKFIVYDHVREYTKTNLFNSNFKEKFYQIPSDIKEIAPLCFSSSVNLEFINIPNTVSAIGFKSFKNCYALTAITLPYGLKTISSKAFLSCTSLKSINEIDGINYLPETVESIEKLAFFDCRNLKNLTLSNVKSLDKCFVQCGLTSLTIPKSIRRIKNLYVDTMTNLKNLTLYRNSINLVKTIDSPIIVYCSDILKTSTLDIIKENKHITFINNSTLVTASSHAISINLATYIDTLYDGCFENCYNLVSVNIPSGITYLGANSFKNCENLSSAKVPNVSKIPESCYENCKKLISVSIPSTVTSIGPRAFANCSKLTDIDTSNINFFSKSCFESCRKLCSINLGNIKSIPIKFLKNCISIKTIVIPEHVNYISDSAFENCTSLKNITFESNSCNKFGNYVFENCISLSEIQIPTSLKFISERCFMNCRNLTNIYFHDETRVNETLPDLITELKSSAFEKCFKLVRLNLNNVKTIGDNCFDNCASLTELKNYTSKIKIGNNVFKDCISFNRHFDKTVVDMD